ncbi:hypothetical protein KUTeg_022918 [Tegillarca granosa]|uniref:C1q domain-containing protein n=1 Tax=Tegillarca granosa TaxID=220873 RepID=A0ABQ9E6E3_TEGGR|nr:hypothetical protein KUTeg_022918 [Tegillarca granosa]
MFRYISIIAVLIAIYVNGDFMEEIGKRTLKKRHDGYIIDIGYLVKFLKDFEADRKEQKTQLTKLQTEIDRIKNEFILMKKKTASQINVAFHAWLSKSDTKSLIVRYNRVTTNIGNGYSANTGKFVAPVSGIYLLAATIIGKSGCPEHLDIFKNNERVGMVRSERTKDSDSGSSVIVLDLTISDSVYLKHFGHSTCKRLRTYKDYAFNTFSGFLIKQHN